MTKTSTKRKAAPLAKAGDAKTGATKSAGATILVIDDEPYLVSSLIAFLQYEGYVTLSAFSGEDGLEILKANQVDLVLLDIMLPGLSGIDILMEIRAEHAYAALPVVLMSGSPLPAKQPVIWDVFLPKVFGFDDLSRVVARLIPTSKR